MDRIGCRALVVDDDPVWLATITRTVRSCGADVVTASDLRSARALLTASLDLVVCEVFIQHEACFSLLEAARRLSDTASVIAVSACAPRPMVFRLREFGVTVYLDKPFSPATLQSCVAALPRAGCREARQARYRPPGRAHGDGVLDSCRDRYGLTGAETDVLRCALEGLSHREIAAERARSLNTVKTLVRSLLVKSGAPTLRLLVRQLQPLYHAERTAFALEPQPPQETSR